MQIVRLEYSELGHELQVFSAYFIYQFLVVQHKAHYVKRCFNNYNPIVNHFILQEFLQYFMKQQVQTQHHRPNLFRILETGDRRVSKALDQAIMIIGLTRSGKSSLFNYILNNPMIGLEDPDDHQRTIYAFDQVKISKNGCFAEISSSYESVTLQPNVGTIQVDGKTISLVDMAGFGDSRDAVQIIAVSYFLISCFQKLKKMKFIIVLSEKSLYSQTIDSLNTTFEDFTNLFKMDIFPLNIREKFMGSISLVITSAKETSQNHKKKLMSIVKRLEIENKLKKLKNKDLIKQILQNVVKENRIYLFEQAQQGKIPKGCQILKKLNSNGWQFFDFQEAKETIKSKFFVNPFQRDYENLQKHQQEQIVSILKEKADTFNVAILSIFLKPLQNLTNNWKSLHQQADSSNPLNKILPYQTIQSFLKELYVYPQYPQFEDEDFQKYRQINNNSFPKIILVIINLFKIKSRLGRLREQSLQLNSLSVRAQMNSISEILKQVPGCLISFCQKEQEVQQLAKVRFLIQRFYVQYIKFYQLMPELLHDVRYSIYDGIQQVIKEESKYLEQFIGDFNKQNLQKRIFNLEELQDYDKIIAQYKHSVTHSQQGNQLQMYEKTKAQIQIKCLHYKWDVELRRCQLQLCQKQSINAISTLLNQLRSSLNFPNFYQSLQYQNQEKQIKLLQLRELSACKKLIKCLQKLDTSIYPDHLQKALKLCKLTKSSYQEDRLFRIILQKSDLSYYQELQILNQYIDHCFDWGKEVKLKDLYLRRLSLAEEHGEAEEIQRFQKDLINMADLTEQIQDKYQNKLESLSKLYSAWEIESFNQLIQSIESLIAK